MHKYTTRLSSLDITLWLMTTVNIFLWGFYSVYNQEKAFLGDGMTCDDVVLAYFDSRWLCNSEWHFHLFRYKRHNFLFIRLFTTICCCFFVRASVSCELRDQQLTLLFPGFNFAWYTSVWASEGLWKAVDLRYSSAPWKLYADDELRRPCFVFTVQLWHTQIWQTPKCIKLWPSDLEWEKLLFLNVLLQIRNTHIPLYELCQAVWMQTYGNTV